MVIAKRPLLAAGTVTAVLVFGGCGIKNPAARPTPAQWAADVGRDLNCRGTATLRRGWPQYYDITGDGTPDTFVDMICEGTDNDTAPDQVEVFSGSTGASRSTFVQRLTWIGGQPSERLFLAHGCVYFTGNKVVIIGRRLASVAPGATPDTLVSQVATWTKGKLVADSPTPFTGNGLPPGCG